jgi:hypothetical protein
MERFSAAIGLALSVLSVGGAFDTFTSVGLLPKLIVAALAAALIIFSAASWLAKHIRPAQENVGFGLHQEGRSKLRFFLFAMLLAVLCVGFTWFAWYLTERFTLQLLEKIEADKSATLLIAPDASVDSVTIELPRKQDSACDWHDRSEGNFPRLSIQMISWDSPTPELQIDSFVYPQRVEIDCKPPRVIRRISMPARTTMYLSDDLWTIRLIILAAGGLIWLIACSAMWRWSE